VPALAAIRRKGALLRTTATLSILLSLCATLDAEPRAKNVILFVGDAAGIPTLNAAGIYARRPQGLFIQRMPHIGLMETSSASEWVGDSASTMTAMVTGQKTHNAVLSQSDSAVSGKMDGKPLKTILEYAEERGLATGVVTNSPLTGATPAACYAHVNDRLKCGEIWRQAFHPSYGDGADVMIGAGRNTIEENAKTSGFDWRATARQNGYVLHDKLEPVASGSRRHVFLLEGVDFDLEYGARIAIDVLSRSPKGYFLMVESDLHANDVERCMLRTVAFDALIERTARREKDTLLIFAADHSYDLRVVSGVKAELLLSRELKAPSAAVRVGDTHTGEDVLVAARGPGAARVRGCFANTELFSIMMTAYGWKPERDMERQAPAN
jgi:alkaline phosphatase